MIIVLVASLSMSPLPPLDDSGDPGMCSSEAPPSPPAAAAPPAMAKNVSIDLLCFRVLFKLTLSEPARVRPCGCCWDEWRRLFNIGELPAAVSWLSECCWAGPCGLVKACCCDTTTCCCCC